MKAMLMTAAGASLTAGEQPIPELTSPRHLLVRLRAAGVNPVDAKLRARGTYHPDRLPCVLGLDGAGVVEKVGSGVTRFNPEDEVFFCHGGLGAEPGNYAEYIAVHEDYVARKPDSISMFEAAALPLVFITAWESLFDRAGLAPGQSVLIHGAAGGVGHVAVQLAKYAGARVIATVSSEEKALFVAGLGADRVVDYTENDFVEATMEWTDGRGVDVVFDPVGGATFCKSIDAAAIYGKVVTLLEAPYTAEAIRTARRKNLCIGYELMLTPHLHEMHAERLAQRAMLESAAEMIAEGKLKVRVSSVLPLSEANEAHRMIEAGHTLGKIVLEID